MNDETASLLVAAIICGFAYTLYVVARQAHVRSLQEYQQQERIREMDDR